MSTTGDEVVELVATARGGKMGSRMSSPPTTGRRCRRDPRRQQPPWMGAENCRAEHVGRDRAGTVAKSRPQ